MKRTALLIAFLSVTGAAALHADWPMWGGTPTRNMISAMKRLPARQDSSRGQQRGGRLQRRDPGNPVVANGVVLIGTNNEALPRPKQGGDRGVLMAFREANGEFLWQATFEALVRSCQRLAVPGHRILAAGDRGAPRISCPNRGQVVAADLDGFHDNSNDSTFKEEKLTGKIDPDFLWVFDMMEEVGSFPHNLANSSLFPTRTSSTSLVR